MLGAQQLIPALQEIHTKNAGDILAHDAINCTVPHFAFWKLIRQQNRNNTHRCINNKLLRII